jgi:hypothetical protein
LPALCFGLGSIASNMMIGKQKNSMANSVAITSMFPEAVRKSGITGFLLFVIVAHRALRRFSGWPPSSTSLSAQ